MDDAERILIHSRLISNSLLGAAYTIPMEESHIPPEFFHMLNDPMGRHVISIGSRGRLDWNINSTKDIFAANGKFLLFKNVEALEIDEYIQRRLNHDRYIFRDVIWHDCDYIDENSGSATVIENGAIFARKIALCRNCLDLSAVKKKCRCKYKMANLNYTRHAHYDILSDDIFEPTKHAACAKRMTCCVDLNTFLQQQYAYKVREQAHWYSVNRSARGISIIAPICYASTLRVFSILTRHLVAHVIALYNEYKQSADSAEEQYSMVHCIIL